MLRSLQMQMNKSAVELGGHRQKYSIPQSENDSLQTESEISQYKKKHHLTDCFFFYKL